MGFPFVDRRDAGRQLVRSLHDLVGRPDLIVLGLARGGVPVAAEVARCLTAPLDVLVLSKPALAGHDELARRELERCERRYRGDRPFPDLRGRTVVLVDDGAASGAGMLAAVHALRQHRPMAIIAAAPVMAEGARQMLAQAADRCEAVVVPELFEAVERWYCGFAQTTDDDVRTLLQQAAERETAKQAHARTQALPLATAHSI